MYVEITTIGMSLDINSITAMIEEQDDYLLEVVDVPAVVNQAIIADGLPHLLKCEGVLYETDEWFCCGVERIENGLIQ